MAETRGSWARPAVPYYTIPAATLTSSRSESSSSRARLIRSTRPSGSAGRSPTTFSTRSSAVCTNEATISSRRRCISEKTPSTARPIDSAADAASATISARAANLPSSKPSRRPSARASSSISCHEGSTSSGSDRPTRRVTSTSGSRSTLANEVSRVARDDDFARIVELPDAGDDLGLSGLHVPATDGTQEIHLLEECLPGPGRQVAEDGLLHVGADALHRHRQRLGVDRLDHELDRPVVEGGDVLEHEHQGAHLLGEIGVDLRQPVEDLPFRRPVGVVEHLRQVFDPTPTGGVGARHGAKAGLEGGLDRLDHIGRGPA